MAPATASGHLAVLAKAGIVSSRSDGRHRYYSLADADIAQALEQLGRAYDPPPVTSLRLSREQQRVRAARTCYDHLAGQLGVAVAERLVELGWVDGDITSVSADGVQALRTQLGVDLDARPTTRRPLLRPCKDWTEPGHHIAGVLGAAIATAFLDSEWVARRAGSRALTIAEEGYRGLAALGVGFSAAAHAV